MTISKGRISSPLEAGKSILDSQKLPAQILDALDYVSDKLIRKHLHLTLIVVPNDTQLPASPGLSSPTPSLATASSLSRAATPTVPGSPKRTHSSSPLPLTPTSPFSASPGSELSSLPPNPYNLTLLHASTLSPKAARYLHDTVTKASKKYSLGSGWLSTPSSPSSPTSSDLIRRSLQQNDVLFSNEGLTLLSLDRVYTFKLALSTYSRLLAHTVTCTSSTVQRRENKAREKLALTAAVDELRLLILTQNGRRISKSYLLRSYDHLSVSLTSLSAINKTYKSCFSGDHPIMGLEVDPEFRSGSSVPLITQGIVCEDQGVQKLDCGPHCRGPVTPNGFEDVTPVTRGEWGFLMGDRPGNFGAVETC